MSAFYSVVY